MITVRKERGSLSGPHSIGETNVAHAKYYGNDHTLDIYEKRNKIPKKKELRCQFELRVSEKFCARHGRKRRFHHLWENKRALGLYFDLD